ncbi:hypothetical protein TI04_11720, partial [Achromatium sp. WMS2]
VLESESNQEHITNKYNKVDLKALNQRYEIIIIEVQYNNELDFLQRILYGASKVIVEHLNEGSPYAETTKVISVNILYFNLGIGNDYVYRGYTTFIGTHDQEQLDLTPAQQKMFKCQHVYNLFPEYYIIQINKFPDITHDPLDEWIYLFKHEEIKEGFQARGLTKAKEVLDILKLSTTERQLYSLHQEQLHYEASMNLSSYATGKEDGVKQGHKIGLIEGEAKGREIGKTEGQAALLKRLLTKKFGPLSPASICKLDTATVEQLETWSEAILDCDSIEQLLR